MKEIYKICDFCGKILVYLEKGLYLCRNFRCF